MLQLSNPAWWATIVGTVLGSIGVSDPGMQADVKQVLAGGVALVLAVYTQQHHKTVRNLDTATAAVAAATAAGAPPAPAASSTLPPVFTSDGPISPAPVNGELMTPIAPAAASTASTASA